MEKHAAHVRPQLILAQLVLFLLICLMDSVVALLVLSLIPKIILATDAQMTVPPVVMR